MKFLHVRRMLSSAASWAWVALVVAAGSLALTSPASALVISGSSVTFDTNDVGNVFDVTYFCAPNGGDCGNQINTTTSTVSASLWWTIDSLTTTEGVFTVKIIHDSTDENGDPDGVFSAFGVDVITSNVAGEPFPTGVGIANASDGTDVNGGGGTPTNWSAGLDAGASGGFGQVDLCVFTAGCSGGNQSTGLAAGGMDMVTLTLLGDFSGTTTFDGFNSKFQSIAENSYEPPGTPAVTDTRPDPVPEPASFTLFGIGLAGLGFAATRRRQRKMLPAGS